MSTDENPFAPPATAIAEVAARSDDIAFAVSIVCAACEAKIGIGDERCAGCQRGVSKQEKQALQRRWEASDANVAKVASDRYWGRVAITGAAALASAQALGSWLLESDTPFVWGGGIALLLWALFAWSFRSAFACGVALVVYVFWWIGLIVVTGNVVGGFLLRMLIAAALGAGLGAELRMRRRQAAIAAGRARR